MSAYYRADSYAVGSSERVVADESISFWVVWRRKVFDAFDFDFCDPRNLQQNMQGFSLYREMVSDLKERLSVDYEDATANQVLEAYKAFEKELAKDLE